MNDRRIQIVASIGARLTIGAYPLAFILGLGSAYGKEVFDVAAAALNWASYLNVLLLSGFALAPPAMARLLAGSGSKEDNRASLRDHVALERALLLVALCAAVLLWFFIGRVFPELAERGGNRLSVWYPMFAVLSVSQLPLTLWMGIAQAVGEYRAILVWTLVPRLLAILALFGASAIGLDATVAICASVLVVLVGQLHIARLGRDLVDRADSSVLETRGRAANVFWSNLSSGLISLVGTLVTIAPVTLVGHVLPDEVGVAHVLVTLSNAFGAIVVAAFFPLSLRLAVSVLLPGAMRRHSLVVARGVGALAGAALALAWLTFPGCSLLIPSCGWSLYLSGSLVLLGAGFRLASLGVLHSAISRGHPHLSLVSAFAEGAIVTALAWVLVKGEGILGIGLAFFAGGVARLVLAFMLELPLIERTADSPKSL